MPSSAGISTAKRSEPHQKRSQKTHNIILSAAADLLIEIGFEKLSTNLICKRAGLTPPALYRYFPNKYAVLKALGENLMREQNAILDAWQLDMSNLATLDTQIERFLAETIAVTREMKAGSWIMRSLHATPLLADVRLNSHRRVAKALAERIQAERGDLDAEQVYQSMRLGVELGYAVVEMIFDETEMDASHSIQMAAQLLGDNLRRILGETPQS